MPRDLFVTRIYLVFRGNPKRPINVIMKILPQNCLILITFGIEPLFTFSFLEPLQISFDGLTVKGQR